MLIFLFEVIKQKNSVKKIAEPFNSEHFHFIQIVFFPLKNVTSISLRNVTFISSNGSKPSCIFVSADHRGTRERDGTEIQRSQKVHLQLPGWHRARTFKRPGWLQARPQTTVPSLPPQSYCLPLWPSHRWTWSWVTTTATCRRRRWTGGSLCPCWSACWWSPPRSARFPPAFSVTPSSPWLICWTTHTATSESTTTKNLLPDPHLLPFFKSSPHSWIQIVMYSHLVLQ